MYRSSSFVFDGVPSEIYGLMIYFMDDAESREISLGTDINVIEDRLPKRISPIHYGVDINKSMSFPLTFGSTDYLEDYDVDAILSWLTGHQQYKWLEFIDGDHYVRYKCHLNNMQSIYINGLPTAFTCDVECDSQFAYEYPTINEYEIDDTEAYIEYFNKSAYNGYLYPELKIEFNNDCNSLSIINESDNNREFKINYFDREVHSESKLTYNYETTLASEAANIEENTNFISWTANTITYTGNYNEIITGTVEDVEVWVALPENGDKALYSKDQGATWNEASVPLPCVGNWTGCFGDNGFVVICTDEDKAIASYSQTGERWWNTIIELPVEQKWTKVKFVETEGFMPNQYLAIGDSDSAIAAISVSGYGWSLVSLSDVQEWRSIVTGNNKALLIGGNENVALLSSDCEHWESIELPKNAAWSAGCYGPNGFIIVADTLHGSGAQEAIALRSLDGRDWEIIDFPLGAWTGMSFNNNTYIAIGDKQFAYSFDGITWNNNTLPSLATNIAASNDYFICPLNNNKYITSNSPTSIQGSFTLDFITDLENNVDNIYISALVDNTLLDTSYASNKTLLGTYISGSNSEEPEISGGNYIAVTTDLRKSFSVDGVMMSAVYDPETKLITLNYIFDTDHTSVANALLTIFVEYDEISTTDLGYDGLIVNFDNQNQIITTNKESLNMYEYFNRRFLRFIKGLNKLKIKTDSGSCKITITSEFLRKVGGR